MLAKTSKSRFTNDKAARSVTAIFEETEEFANTVSTTRMEVYRYIELLLETRTAAVRGLGDSFVQGMIALGEREKDPRNLMMWFRIIRQILEFWDISKFETDLWEGLKRYFPISYKGNDSIGVTADDLKLELRGCIAGNSAFAKEALPFLTDKLDDQVSANIKVSMSIIRTQGCWTDMYLERRHSHHESLCQVL
jgi:DNA repair/transcription protein MET18/MMS19